MPRDSLSRRTIAGLALVVLSIGAGLLAAPSLPARLSTHWNAAGQPDGTMARPVVLVGGPALVLGVVVLFEVLPRIDPLGENIAAFRTSYDLVAVATAAFLAYVYGLLLAWNLGYAFAIGQALAPAIGALFVVVGFVLERAEQNWFVGVRTPWTLSSERVWRETHDLAGPLFKLAGLVAAVGALFPAYTMYFIVVPIAVVALVTTGYSYHVYRGLDDESGTERL